MFFLWWLVYHGERSSLSSFKLQDAKGKLLRHRAGWVPVIIDVDLRWLYRAGAGRLKSLAFTVRQSCLSHRQSQTLNCLLWKLDFYPLRLGSGFPRCNGALLEKHAAVWGHEKLVAQTSSSSLRPLTFKDQSRYWSPTGAARLWASVYLSARQTEPKQVSCFWHGPTLSPA